MRGSEDRTVNHPGSPTWAAGAHPSPLPLPKKKLSQVSSLGRSEGLEESTIADLQTKQLHSSLQGQAHCPLTTEACMKWMFDNR